MGLSEKSRENGSAEKSKTCRNDDGTWPTTEMTATATLRVSRRPPTRRHGCQASSMISALIILSLHVLGATQLSFRPAALVSAFAPVHTRAVSRIRPLFLQNPGKRPAPRRVSKHRASGSSGSGDSLPVASFSKHQQLMNKLEKSMVSLGRSGRTDEALKLFYDAERPSMRLWNGAIDACARARPPRLETAMEIFHSTQVKWKSEPNVFTFGALVSACSRAQRADQALKILRDMEPSYGVAPNAVVFSSVISACARSAKKDIALQLLREAVEQRHLPMNVVGFNAAISACAQEGDWKNAITLLQRMEAANRSEDESEESSTEQRDLRARVPAPDAVTYGTVLSACERGGQWERLLQLAKSMPNENMLDTLGLSSCLHACQQLGLADDAVRYLDRMKESGEDDNGPDRITMGWKRKGAKGPLRGPDAVAYRLAISACARGGAWEDGLSILSELEDIGSGDGADVAAYTSAIAGCEYAGEWRQAFQLLDRMRKRGVQPNEVTMAAVLGACATACAKLKKTNDAVFGASDEAPSGEDMLLPQRKALQLLNVMKKDPSVVNPNIQVYNAAIRVCAEAYDLKRAMKLFEEIKANDIPRTIVTYGSLMTACERIGCVQSASIVFRSLRSEEEEDMEPNEIVYGAAISCCRKAGESERALLLLRKMIREGMAPNVATFNTVLAAQTEGRTSRKDMEQALLVYKLMKSGVSYAALPSRQTYALLIRCMATNQQPALAEVFLNYMRDSGLVPDVDLYTATVTGYERIGQPLKALQLMESMEEVGYDFYSIPVLNTAFKNAVKLANAVGRGLKGNKKNFKEAESLVWDDKDIEENPDADHFMSRQTN